MIHINSYKLTPAITATWGDITGNVSNQEDLVEYINEHGTAAWGSISGNISDQSDLMSTLGSYATESWVSSQQFATESWVSEQGYLTSVPSEYATQSWVSEQGYLTSSALTGYATESWVSEQGYLTSSALTGYATESWVADQNYINDTYDEVYPLFHRTEGYLRQHFYTPDADCLYTYGGTEFFDQYGQCYVWNIGDTVYAINFLTPEYDGDNNPHIYIYYYDRTNNRFEHKEDSNGQWIEINGDVTIPMINQVSQAHFLWEDSQGRVYYGLTHKVDLETGTFTAWNFGIPSTYAQSYNGSKNNIIKFNGNIYLLRATSNSAGNSYLFDEETQTFSLVGNLTGHLSTAFYRYGFYYEGSYYAIMRNTLGQALFRRLVNNHQFMPANPAPFPASVTVHNNLGQEVTTIVTGDLIRKITRDGGETYEYYCIISSGAAYASLLKLVNGEWLELVYNRDSRIIYNTNGAECGDYMVGFGYSNDVSGAIPVWNFSPSYVLSNYGWDNSVETRLTDIETNLGTALTITNNILS